MPVREANLLGVFADKNIKAEVPLAMGNTDEEGWNLTLSWQSRY